MNKRTTLLLVLAVALIGGLAALLSQSGDESADPGPELASVVHSGQAEPEPPGSLPVMATGGDRDLAQRVASGLSPEQPAVELGDLEELKERTGQFKGRVVGPHGEPIAGAEVRVSRNFGGLHLSLGGSKREASITDAAGYFEAKRLSASALMVVVKAGGYAILRQATERPKGGEEMDLGVFTLELGVQLRGVVFDFHGRPVADAEVVLQPAGSAMGVFFMNIQSDDGPSVRTKVDGSFELDSVAVGPWAVMVQHPLHPGVRVTGVCERAGLHPGPIQIRLQEGGSVSGHIVGLADGQECAVIARRQGFGFMMDVNFQRSAEAGADGAFQVQGLLVDSEYLFVVQEMGGPVGFGVDLSEGVAGRAGQVGIVLEVRGSAGLRFQVVNAETGAAIEDFQTSAGGWWLKELRDADGKVVTHHPDGRVHFTDVENHREADEVSLLIVAEGYADHSQEGLRMLSGEVLNLGVIALLPVPLLRVRVLADASGEPVKDARVQLMSTTSKSSGSERFAFLSEVYQDDIPSVLGATQDDRRGSTDAGGWTSLTTIPGAECVLKVNHWQYADLLLPARIYEGGDVEVRLLVGGMVSVLVLQADGTPAARVEVSHRLLRMGSENRRGGSKSKPTGPKGRVGFRHLPVGTHGFRLKEDTKFEGFMVIGRQGEDRPKPGDSWELVEVEEGSQHEVLLHALQRGTLVGRVTEGGRPVAGASLRLEEWVGEGEGAEADRLRSRQFGILMSRGGERTKGDGSFRLEERVVGEYLLIVSHASRAMDEFVRVSVRAGESEVHVDLPTTAIEGIVVDDQGRPVAGASVAVQRQGEQNIRQGVAMIMGSSSAGHVSFSTEGDTGDGETDSQGRFRVQGLESGRELELKVSGHSYQPETVEIAPLHPDEVRSGLRVVLNQGGGVEAMMLMADGRPAEFGTLVLKKIVEGEGEGETRHAGAHQGSAKLEGLAPGEWRASATVFDLSGLVGGASNDTNEMEQIIEIVAGEVTEVLFQF